VPAALDQLGVAAPRPHGLADADHRARPGSHQEVAPGGDDAGGVAAQLLHVDEADRVAVAPQRVLQEPSLVLAHRHQRDAVRRERSTDFRHCPGHVLVAVCVEDGLVVEAGHGVA
jgi:hypothetical protein